MGNVYFSKKAIVKRKLRKAVHKRISHFSSGETAKITGKVELVDEGLLSPLSNRKCAYYYVHVQQKVSSGKSSHWKTIIEEEATSKFIIRDGSHYAYINSTNIKSYILQDRKFSSGFLNDATDTLESYLREHGRKSENIFGLNKRLRYKEGVLEPGEEIAVLGTGEWKNASQIQLPETYSKVLVMSSIGNEPLYMSDDPDTVRKEF